MAIKKIDNYNIHENPATNKNDFDIENYLNANWNKTKDVVNNNADELTALQQDNTTNKQEIANIQKEQTTQNKNINNNTDNIEILKAEKAELETECERLKEDIDNTVPSVSSNGENITLNGTAEARFKKFGIGGNSWQEMREGYNLLNLGTFNESTKNGMTCSQVDNSSINLSGTTNAVTNFWFNNLGIILSAGTYKFKLNENIIGIAFFLKDTNGTNILQTAVKDNLIELKEEKTFSDLLIQVNSNVSLTNKEIDLMLYKGTEDRPYEAYGTMPSSDFPSEIKTVKDSINFTICNKNFFNTEMEQGSIFGATGINFEATTSLRTKDFIKINKNGKYTINCNGMDSVYVFCYNKNKKFISRLGNNWNTLPYIFTPEASTKYLKVVFKKNDGSVITADMISHIQLEEGEVATNCVEHKEQSFTFPLVEGQRLWKKNENEYDYLSDEGIVNVLEQTDETGTKTIEESFKVRETPLITAYTKEQQVVYNEIKKTAKSYGDATHIFSTDEISPIFNVEARADITAVFNNLQAQVLANEEV